MRLSKRKTLLSALLLFLLTLGGYFSIFYNLPNISTLEEYKPNLITKVYSKDGRTIGEFYIEKRIVVEMEKIPKHLVEAFLAAEDSKFFEHEGLDYLSILRALYKNITAGRIVQGGSTITQQVAKSFFLTPERKLSRKIKEAILASRIEKRLSKEDILYLYLNQIYLGSGAYGVEAASQTYFGKHVEELTLAESALLAGLPKSPSTYSPYLNPELARSRQEFALTRMLEEGFITREQSEKAFRKKLLFKPKKDDALNVGPYFTEHIRRYLEETYGEELLYRGGLEVHTAMDVEFQKYANKAIDYGLRAYDKRHGYRGPVAKIKSDEELETLKGELEERLRKEPMEPGSIYKAVVESVNKTEKTITVAIGDRLGVINYPDLVWAKLYNPTDDPDGGKLTADPPGLLDLFTKGDVIEARVKAITNEESPIQATLEQTPLAQASLIAIEPETGYVRAMVGGLDFSDSEYNRAIQAKRQPGSAFKPIIYAAAVEKGYTPATIVMDSPIVFEDSLGETEDEKEDWKPRNFDEKFHGPTTLRDALAKSRNVVTIKILKDIGAKSAISLAEILGIESPLSENLSLALGSSAVSLIELTRAFGIFANQGVKTKEIFITRVVDRNGTVLEENTPIMEDALSPETSFIITNLLQGVVENGTGRRAKALGRPVAAKTGTTNNLNDAWFIGYVPGLTAGAWIGYDSEKTLGRGETGSRAASPIWIKFMENALSGTRIKNFPVPDGIEFVKIDPKTGLLAGPSTKEPIFEAFKIGSAPTKIPDKRGASADEELFLMDYEKTPYEEAPVEGPENTDEAD